MLLATGPVGGTGWHELPFEAAVGLIEPRKSLMVPGYAAAQVFPGRFWPRAEQ